jgi:D-arabinose 1-dehydrogenase-like Zn-dependent alcohol dehydrogenase
MTATVTRYTAEQTTEMVAQYAQGVSVEFIAEAMGKSVRSVIAKLSREQVYKAKGKAVASERVTKAQLVAMIAVAVGASEEALESLEKATTMALVLVAASLK